MAKGFRGMPTSRGGMVRGWGGGGGYRPSRSSGGRLYSGGGYQSSYPSYTPHIPSYTQEAIDAVQEAIRKRQAEDQRRLASLKAETIEVRYQQRAEYEQLTNNALHRREAQGGAVADALNRVVEGFNKGRS